MNTVSFQVSGLKEARGDMKQFQIPPLKTIARLEKELASAFADTQAATHIITHSLKTSGKVSSDFDGNSWDADITYGGEAAGAINDPVDYAIYERARGGEHDFMAPAFAHEDAFGDILNKHFDEVTRT